MVGSAGVGAGSIPDDFYEGRWYPSFQAPCQRMTNCSYYFMRLQLLLKLPPTMIVCNDPHAPHSKALTLTPRKHEQMYDAFYFFLVRPPFLSTSKTNHAAYQRIAQVIDDPLTTTRARDATALLSRLHCQI